VRGRGTAPVLSTRTVSSRPRRVPAARPCPPAPSPPPEQAAGGRDPLRGGLGVGLAKSKHQRLCRSESVLCPLRIQPPARPSRTRCDRVCRRPAAGLAPARRSLLLHPVVSRLGIFSYGLKSASSPSDWALQTSKAVLMGPICLWLNATSAARAADAEPRAC